MNNPILVAYASKYGATAEIAEKIGQTLRSAGLQVDVLPADKVANPAAYDAIVLGSAVYVGGWRKEAIAFLEANEAILKARPVWFFSSGPTGEGDAVALMKGWRFPQAQQPVADRIGPRDIVVFHGMLNTQKLSLPEKLIIKGIKAPLGDYRQWNAVIAWANGIAAALAAEPVA